MFTVREYSIILSNYHDEIVARVSFVNAAGEIEESNLYSPGEINNLIALWQMDALLGSFGIGTRLAENARMTLRVNT